MNSDAPIEVEDDDWPTIPQGLAAYKDPLQSRRHKVLDLGEMGSDSRVRFSMSFYACSPGGDISANYPSESDSASAVDFDAVLVDAGTQDVIDVSNSFDDTNEGFDVYLPEGGDDIEVWVIFPPPSEDPRCNGSSGDPYAWAAAWW